jgi:hypothetical protein
MKTALVLTFALIAAGPMQAEIFRPALRGSATIGHHQGGHDRSSWQGGFYTGGPGWVVGATFGEGYRRHGWDRGYFPRYGYGGYYGYRTVISTPVIYSGYDYPYDYGTSYQRSNPSGSGLVLGALAGAIIGNNSGSLGHNAWRGAAYGAGLGYLFGSLVEHNDRQRAAAAERAASVQALRESVPVTETPSQAPVTIINNYYNAPATAMSQANSMFGR